MPDVDAAALALNSRGEQCRLLAYDDLAPAHTLKSGDRIRGRLTIGWGHTGPDVRIGLTWTQSQADAAHRADLSYVEAAVARLVKVDLTRNQFGALADFAFNAGIGALAGSRLLRLVNQDRPDLVPHELMRWVRARGVVLPGLVARRAGEAALWTIPDAPDMASPPLPDPPTLQARLCGLLKRATG